MSAYFEYLKEMVIRFFSDLGRFFNKVFASPWADVPGNFDSYGSIFGSYSPEFGFWGWFFWVLFLILFIALIAGIGFLIFILIRKYVKFYKREVDKDELQSQVERLNYELYTAVQEKDKILNLKVGYMGLKPEDGKQSGENEEQQVDVDELNSRFPKLVHVDKAYKGVDMTIPFKDGLSLEELCNSLRNYAASQEHLYYKIETIRQLFAGIATSKLIILEGISGTGKTSLAYVLGKFFNFDSAIIPVQPSWKDRSELLGYYNEFTKKFNESEFLKALYVTTYRKDLDVIVLDEMNLARIEYYFAEFLSIMEMRDTSDWLIDLIPSTQPGDPINLKEGKLLIPQNVVFFGTANNDDSTFTISDKVYDRAISLFFDDKGRPFDAEYQDPINVPYNQLKALFDDAINQYPISDAMLDKFNALDNFVIKKFKLAFGNRILKQLTTFIPVYVACGGKESDGFDFIFANKILKKFESLNLAFLKDELKELNTQLDKLYGKNTFPMSHATIDGFIKNY
ncbi:MAG: hypothetical protein E7178_03150 [Erysipelotrichaceae bacterium]|nr:hypothetical protein [Erysipelotrichaceae bacterium]